MPNWSNLKSVTDAQLFPFDANVDGLGSSRTARFNVWTVYAEQQLAPDLFVEAALFRNIGGYAPLPLTLKCR